MEKEEIEVVYTLKQQAEQQAENLQSIQDWTNKHFKNKKCPNCNNNQWIIPRELLELRPFTGGSLIVGGTVCPLLTLICDDCGHTLLFNAIVAGLVKKPEKESEEVDK